MKKSIFSGIKDKLVKDEKSDLANAMTEINEYEKKEKRKKCENEISSSDKTRGVIQSARKDVREMISHVIEPEEKTLKNYVSFSFWKKKRKLYVDLKMKEHQDLNIYSVLYDSARPTIEYYILTVLSCIIATTGLIQGSGATIIGAMIVAPLMTPILAFSLGVIWGDTGLMKTSLSSLLKGVVLAVFISSVISFLVPFANYTPEIISRTKPTLFDIIVALTSGFVGAYGYANKRISSSLVGIAIAVALMPPLCTVGIGIGTLNYSVATGAAVLFLINLISISLAGAIVFWAMKIHPIHAHSNEVKKRAIYQIIFSVIILIIISIPVGIYMYDGYLLATSQEKVRISVESQLPDTEIIQFKTVKISNGYRLDLTLTGDTVPSAVTIDLIKKNIYESSKVIKNVHLRYMPSTKF
ncbi:MAG: TIGR00341 family protein [Spirochaetes bacterium]|nr:TIGR00341 family protein [Spirochaetota bacterium]